MESSVDLPAPFFDRLVLISNSVPKSGSTLLFAMQQNFLLSLAGRRAPDYSAFTRAGVQVDAGYVGKPHSREFLEVITSDALTGGPHVIKTHTLLNADLREAIVASPHVFASVSIRDPLEVYYSARDNFLKSGEFPEFAELDRGCETVSGYFAKIFESSVNTSRQKAVPLIRYEQIVADPIGALVASLHPLIRDQVMRRIAQGYLNLDAAVQGAAKRLNIGGLDRLSADRANADFPRVAAALAATRRSFGYAAD